MGRPRKSLFKRVARANAASADLFLSIHHDSVPDSFLEAWEYQGEEHHFSDRFKGHSLFFSIDNADPDGSLEFGKVLGEQLQSRGLQYTPHYIEKFMGHRQKTAGRCQGRRVPLRSIDRAEVDPDACCFCSRPAQLSTGTRNW